MSESASVPGRDSLGLERIVFFSDAVIAIAITLLVIDLKVPDVPAALAAQEIPARLLELMPKILSFLISFGVTGIYWAAHHRMFGYIERYDRGLLWLNILFLLFIAFLPFPTALIGTYGSLQIATIIYTITVGGMGLVRWLIWRYALGHHLTAGHLSAGEIRREDWRSLIAPVVFFASIPVSFLGPYAAEYFWLLIIPLSFYNRWGNGDTPRKRPAH